MFSTSVLLYLALFTGVAQAQSAFAPPPLLDEAPSLTYCDVQLLAEAWSVDMAEAKATIRSKLLQSGMSGVQGALDFARTDHRDQSNTLCNLPMHDIGYGEAEALSGLWGVDVAEAKAMASAKLFFGNADNLYGALEEASGGHSAPDVSDEDGAWEVWHRSGFRYCDAKILADAWQVDAWDAKVRGGRKIAAESGTEGLRDLLLTTAQAKEGGGFTCSIMEGDVSYDDAVLLAEAWDLADADEAKVRVEDKLAMGRGPDIQEMLAGFRGTLHDADYGAHEMHEQIDDQPDVDAFFDASSDYSFCDAQVLAQSWQSSEREAKAAIGYKLRHEFTSQIPAMLEGAREQLRNAGAAERCSAQQSGVTAHDLGKLATKWKLGPEATLVRAEEMLFAGQWAELQAEISAPIKKRRRRWFRRSK